MNPIDVTALAVPRGARLMIGLAGNVEASAISPDGDVLAVGGGGMGLELIRIPTARGLAARADLKCTAANPKSLTCAPDLAFAADGKRLAAWWQETKRLVVIAVPSVKTELDTRVEYLSSFRFLDDGRLVVLHGRTSSVYDAGGTRRDFFQTPTGRITHVASDGQRIVVFNDDDDSFRILDVATGKVIAMLPKNPRIDDVVLGRDATWVASMLKGVWVDIVTSRPGDRTVRTLASSAAARRAPGGDRVWGFDFPPPHDQVFVGMSSGLIGVALDGTPRLRSAWVRDQIEHGSIVRTSNGIVVRRRECIIRLDAQGSHASGPTLCAMRPGLLGFDGDHLLARHGDVDGITTFDLRTGALVASQILADLQPATGRTLVAVARDPELAKRVARALALPGVNRSAFDLSPDGKRLFIGYADGGASIIDLATNRARTGLENFIVSGDGSRIAIRRKDDETLVDVRTVDDNRLLRTLTTPTILVDRMALSHDGGVFAADGNGTVSVLDVSTGRTLFEAPCRGSYAGHVELSADGRLLVCDTRRAVEVYDVRSKKLVKRVEHPYTESVDTFALSSDGRRLAIGQDNIVIVDL